MEMTHDKEVMQSDKGVTQSDKEVTQSDKEVTQSHKELEVTQSDKEVTQFEKICPCGFFPKRYMVGMLSFLGFANLYAMRANLSVAIAVMVANQTVVRDGKEIQVMSLTYFLKLGIFLRIKPLQGATPLYTEHTFSFTLSCNRQTT